MSEKTTKAEAFTAEEIYQKINELQRLICDKKNTPAAYLEQLPTMLHFSRFEDYTETDMKEVLMELCEAFTSREATYQKLMGVYSKVLDALIQDQISTAKFENL